MTKSKKNSQKKRNSSNSKRRSKIFSENDKKSGNSQTQLKHFNEETVQFYNKEIKIHIFQKTDNYAQVTFILFYSTNHPLGK